MFKERDGFYYQALSGLLKRGLLDVDSSILVTCGGELDCEVLRDLGFKQVTISNLDSRMRGTEYAPYQWSFQNAEKLTYADGQFEFCIEHNGLHHCYSPHKALLEMYRVAKQGIVMFEPYDNWLSRLGVAMGIGQDFEHAAVFYNDLVFGGVENSWLPNYIYRWTRRELVKTIRCYSPWGESRFEFIHQLRVPWQQLKGRKNPLFLWGVVMAWPILRLLSLALPRQTNCFAAAIFKPDPKRDLHPWLQLDSEARIELNRSWLERRYRKRG